MLSHQHVYCDQKQAWQDFFLGFEPSRVQACDVEAEGAFREDDQGVVECDFGSDAAFYSLIFKPFVLM